MNELDPLRQELDLWGEDGRTATLWWRDDDAEAPDAPILRLLALSETTGAPVFIATVPDRAVDALAEPMLHCATAIPLQHGFAHADHSPKDVKGKWELGLHRPQEVILAELRAGSVRMRDLFGDRVCPMLAPPWNRIAPELFPHLPDLGFDVVSVFAPRAARDVAPGLQMINGHCDLIAWKRGRSFIGPEKTAARLVEHLAARRTGEVDAAEPTGLLTHVWAQDEDCWAVLEAVLRLMAAHPAACWLDRESLMPERAAA
jgi:hypothetical protein